MSKKKKIIIFILIIVAIIFWAIAKFNVELDEVDGEGKFLKDVTSPTKEYKAIAYIMNDGGPTVRAQLRVGIDSYGPAERSFDDKTIYWDIDAENKNDPDIKWIDNHTVSINGIKVDIYNEDTYYNWRDHYPQEKEK
ncbi:DUF5412 family protein [Priestia endophytica]|uniref:DUF5412 domain-containing protein n=1 Tax=Priestia endophytica TaxID=135735 RepID=A0AAX1QA94_9BACI|nr:DUF5412 family protein [Priestia endophytica]RAS75505.1 hypothetical protein A3864_16050 [Priestia endophytica]